MNAPRWGLAKLFHRRGRSVDQACPSRSQSFIPSLSHDPFTGVSAYEVLRSQGHSRSYTTTGRPFSRPHFAPEAHPAFRALYPNLPQPRRSRRKQLSTDLHCLTLSNEAGKLPFCEDVADRNGITTSPPIKQSSDRPHKSKRRSTLDHPFSTLHHYIAAQALSDTPTSLQCQPSRRNAKYTSVQQHIIDDDSRLIPVKTRTRDERPHSVGLPILRYEERRNSLSRKPNMFDLRTASETSHLRSASLPTNHISSGSELSIRPSFRRYLLEKPLPPLPVDAMDRIKRHRHINEMVSAAADDSLAKATCNALEQLNDTAKVITTDTTVYRRWAPAVTHETISTDLHEIKEEQIVREIHQDHYRQRIQPVIDVEILPARHFVPRESGGYSEISEPDVPAGVAPSPEWIRQQLLSRLIPEPEAAEFHGFDGASKESLEDESSTHVRTTYKPAVQGEVKKYPVHFTLQDLSNDDTLRETRHARPPVSFDSVRGNKRRNTSRDEKFPVL